MVVEVENSRDPQVERERLLCCRIERRGLSRSLVWVRILKWEERDKGAGSVASRVAVGSLESPVPQAILDSSILPC